MGKWIVIIVLTLGIGFISYKYIKKNKEKKEAQVSYYFKSKAIKADIFKVVVDKNAIDDWSMLNNIKRTAFTFDLQDFFIQERPILFVGNIVDIYNKKDKRIVVMELSSYYGVRPLDYYYQVLLYLEIEKKSLDVFLKTINLDNIEKLETLDFDNRNFVAIAFVKSIERFETQLKIIGSLEYLRMVGSMGVDDFIKGVGY